jgi:hypothetical protein
MVSVSSVKQSAILWFCFLFAFAPVSPAFAAGGPLGACCACGFYGALCRKNHDNRAPLAICKLDFLRRILWEPEKTWSSPRMGMTRLSTQSQ